MDIRVEDLHIVLEQWKTGRWFERLAYRLITNKRFKIIDKLDGLIYLIRMYILGNSKTTFSLWLHFFPKGDTDRSLHDHPFPFISYVVAGSYEEELLRGWEHRKQGSLVIRGAHCLHRVHTEYAWTLVIRGPKIKSWGFLVDGKMVQWWKFLGLTKREVEE